MPTPHHSRRRVLRTAGTVALAGGLAGCFDADSTDTDDPRDAPPADGTDDTPGTDDSSERTGRDLRLASTGYRTLDPIAATDPASVAVVSKLYQGLTTFPVGVPDPEPLLAEEIAATDAGRTYRVELRPGVRFHDPVDRELRAEDVVYSFERLAGSEHSAYRSLVLDDLGVVHDRTEWDAGVTADEASGGETSGGEATEEYVPSGLGVEAVDDRTVEIELVEPTDALESVLAHPALCVVPTGVVGDVPGREGDIDYETFATRSPVGTGPFRFDDDTPDGEYRVAAREAAHTETPSVAGIHWTRVPDAEAGFERAVAGEVDAVRVPDGEYDPDETTVVRIDDRGRKTGTYGPVEPVGEPFDYQRVSRLATAYLGLNPTRVPKPVRRALAYAVNPTAQAVETHRDRAVPAAHLTPPALFPGGRDGALDHGQSYPFGLAEARVDAAREELFSAGYNPANSVAVTVTTDGSEVAVRTAERLRRATVSLPVDLSVETVSPSTLYHRWRAGDLDSYWASHTVDSATTEAALRSLAPGTDTGVVGWDASDADAGSVDRAREAWRAFQAHGRDTDEHQQIRAEAVYDVEEANWQDVVCLPLVHPVCEVVSYDYVDLPPTGAVGFSRRTLTDVRVAPRG